MLKYCGAALLALMGVIILKGQKSEFAPFVSLAASVILLGASVLTFLPVIEFVFESVGGTDFSRYLSTLTKALGITVAVQLSADVCRDAGEGSLAAKLELVGKAEILVLCLPLIRDLITLAREMVG